MRKFNYSSLKAGLLALLLASCTAQAGIVIGGTRFIYAQDSEGLSVSVFNQSTEAWLVNTKIYKGGEWLGAESGPTADTPFIATPPLFLLSGGRENKIRIIRAGGNMPQDRETLFTLSIATIPSGKASPNSLQMAIRSALKLFYRPSGLKGSPEQAYTKLLWSRKGSAVVVENPTPYYVTLFQLNAAGHEIDEAGIVAPFAQRTASWCGQTAICRIQWQSINDYGRVLPPVSLDVSSSSPASISDRGQSK